MFISLGIEYDKDKFNAVKNRGIYEDTDFPPTKPIKGGLWGSTYREEEQYVSEWERYIYEVLNPRLFSDKLSNISTLFKVCEGARVLEIRSFNDIWINLENGTSNLALRQVKIGKNVPPQYKSHLFLDFERFAEYYDVIYVSQEFAKRVDWVLKEFERRVLAETEIYDEKLSISDLYISELFEDWNVESILIFNKEVINVKKYVRLNVAIQSE